jgi:inner membrane protein
VTHSLFFAPVAGPLLGAAGWYLAGRSQALGRWMLVMTLALWSHPLLDWLTSYGTQLLRPFSDARFAVDAMPIIDPLYTGLLLLGLLIAGRRPHRAGAIACVTLLVSSAYLGYGWQQNLTATREASRQLAAQGIEGARVQAFPTLLQVYYRRVVARTAGEDRVGFLSTWRPCAIDWQVRTRLRRDDPLQQLNSHNHVVEVFKLVISSSFKNHSLSERDPTS